MKPPASPVPCPKCGAESPCTDWCEVDVGVGVQTWDHVHTCPTHGEFGWSQSGEVVRAFVDKASADTFASSVGEVVFCEPPISRCAEERVTPNLTPSRASKMARRARRRCLLRRSDVVNRTSVFEADERLVGFNGFYVFVFGQCPPRHAVINGVVRFMLNGGRRVRRGVA